LVFEMLPGEIGENSIHAPRRWSDEVGCFFIEWQAGACSAKRGVACVLASKKK
jgi:hypothetical protein